MPWRTFWGYINDYSERFQILIPSQQKIDWNVKEISKFYELFICWLTISALIFLI